MKRQGSGIRDQGSERLIRLLRRALPPVRDDFGTASDLWPQMQHRLRAGAAPAPAPLPVPWFDWALGFGMAGLLALFPAWIPVLLYCL